jgi:aquaporin Z
MGPALFAGGDPLAHVWLFLVAPLVGAAAAAGAARLLTPAGGTEEALQQAAAVLTADETGVQVPGEQAEVPPARTAVDDTGARVREERPTAG